VCVCLSVCACVCVSCACACVSVCLCVCVCVCVCVALTPVTIVDELPFLQLVLGVPWEYFIPPVFETEGGTLTYTILNDDGGVRVCA